MDDQQINNPHDDHGSDFNMGNNFSNTYASGVESKEEVSSFNWTSTPKQEPRQEPFARQREPEQPARSDSPFANSPYQSPYTGNQEQQTPPVEEVLYDNPTPPPQQKPPAQRKSALPVLAMLVSFGALIIALIIFMVTNGRITELKDQSAKQQMAYEQEIADLKDRLTSGSGSSDENSGNSGNFTPAPVPSDGVLTPAQVYTQCVNSTVAINCTGSSYSFGQKFQTGSSGSGFILSEDGYVVTNFHVVEGNERIEVALNDGTSYEAEYIGGNEANDIALIKVDALDLPAVTVGDSTQLVVGDQVVAIGNPLGELASTLTVGYISAKDRIVTSEGTQINMLQTDAAINPGNSGGPLFNMYGQVIGITSAKYSGTTDSGASIEGIGFAIPMDDVMNMLNDLRDFGYITGGYLGVSVSTVDEEASNLYGLPQGVLVREVMDGSCAQKAGMKVQDIIVKLGDYDVKNLNDLSRALNKYKGGDEITVIVYRSGAEQELTVYLDERPQETQPLVEETEPMQGDQYNSWPGDSFFEDWFGNFFG